MRLNLDQLIGEPKQIIFGGKTYNVNEITVQMYLEMMTAQASDADNTERMIEMLGKIVPDLDARKIPMRVLSDLMNFLMAQNSEASEKNA